MAFMTGTEAGASEDCLEFGGVFTSIRGCSGYDGLWANTSFEHLGVHPALVRPDSPG